MIIEGYEIMANYFENYQGLKKFISEQPIIILGKSFLVSAFRSAKRDYPEMEKVSKKVDIWRKYNKDLDFGKFGSFLKQAKSFRKERISQKGALVKTYKV